MVDSSFPSTEAYKNRLQDERNHEEQLNLIVGAIGSTACGMVYYYLSLKFDNSIRNVEYLGYWFSIQIIATFLFVVFILFFNRMPSYRNKWRLIGLPTSAFYGFIWSTCWLVFVDRAHPELFVTWLFIVAGVLSAGILASAFHWPSSLSFTLSLILPVLIDLLINKGLYYEGIMYLLGAGLICAIVFSYLLNRFTIKVIEQREKNYLLAKQLEKEKQHAEKANQEKTRFLAAASHDLRQPIQAIRLFGHILATRLDDPEDKQLLGKINNATDGLATLLDSLLDISRLDAGIINITKQTFCVDGVLSRIYQQYHPIAAEEGIELRYVPSYVSIGSDPQQLERVIRNLVVNAIKHMGKGRILLGVRRATSQILIIDNGIGIPTEEQNKIFDEFYQLNNPERNRSKGLGLGLSIVQRTVLLLGHTMGFESSPNQGCKFTIQLPIISTEKEIRSFTNDLPELVFKTKKVKNILIVEDEKEVQNGLDILLKSWGHTTFLALNKKEALSMNKKNNIHIIVSDYQLQNDDNGIDIILSIRKLYQQELPAILVTGNTNPSTLKKISRYQIPMLSKPYLPSELAVELNNFL